MSLSPAVIDALVAAGCTVEQLAAAVKADMAEGEARLASKREKDAIRQRKSRSSRDVTVTECDNTDAPLSRPPNENISNPPTHTPGDISRARKADPFPCPPDVDPIDWESLLETRKRQRAPMTDGAYRQICKKLAAWNRDGWPPGPIVATAVERGWRTVFKPDERNGSKHDRASPSNDHEPANPYARAVLARQAERAGHGNGQPDSWT